MKTIIEAICEGGLFRPVEKVNLTEGTHVEIRVPQEAARRDPKVVAAKLVELATKAPRSGQPEQTARNHDQILYGGKNQK